MNRDLAREYREAMEEFCSLVTGLAVLGEDDRAELRARITAAQSRCDHARVALYSAIAPSGTPS